jgi:hypothetical protein
MVGMQIAEAQLAARRAWYMQFARCVLICLALIFVIFEVHRRGSGLPWIIWSGTAIVLIAHVTDQTWRALGQLQFARNLTSALTPIEFERAKAQEEWHNAVRDMLLFVAFIVLISLAMRGNAHPPLTPPVLFFLALMPAARVGRVWRKLRRVSA